jgi:hypothetical protein
MKIKTQLATLIGFFSLLAGTAHSLPIGTAFTYQGRLTSETQSANGYYDFKFTLFDAAVSGNVVGGSITNAAVIVSNGFFTVTLDFGAEAIGDAARWLEQRSIHHGERSVRQLLNSHRSLA